MTSNFYLYFYIVLHFVNCKKVNVDDLKSMLSKNTSLVWFDNLTLSANDDNVYCKLCCINIGSKTVGKHCGSHTMCRYPSGNTGPACKGYIQIGFTSDEQQALLDAHNTLRNRVASGKETRGRPGPQPSAANMRLLEWNVELSRISERWAAQCIYSHDLCRDVERFPVGQNIAHGSFSSNNELTFIKSWFDEVNNFDSGDVKKFKISNRSGRYTQIIWADTYQIGCARAVFQQMKGSETFYREHLICNYGPTGNIPDQSVYTIGPPCSSCPEGTTCTSMLHYPSLCGGENVDVLIDEEITIETDLTNNNSVCKITNNNVIFISFIICTLIRLLL